METEHKNNQPIFIDEERPIEPAEQKINKRIKPPKKRKHQPLDELGNIYQKDGELPDMTRLDRQPRNSRGVLVGLIAFFAVIAIAAWAGFFIFKPYAKFEGDGVKLMVNGPDEVKAGEVVRYEFDYQNTEKAALGELELRLVIPNEFHIIELEPEKTSDPYTWTLGSLEQGGEGEIVLRGYFLGPHEGRSAFQSIATYRPSNFNSDFQEITTKPIRINESVLTGVVEGPNEAAPGEELKYTYKVTNTGSEPLENLEVRLEGLESFIFASADPAPNDERNARWTIAKLEPSEEKSIVITGSFAATAKGLTDVPIAIGIKTGDEWLLHRRDLVTTDVLASDVALELFIGGDKKDLTASLGDTLPISLSYENLGDRTIGDLVISLTIAASPSGLIDWDGAEMGEQPGRIKNGVITWTKNEIADLRTVRPGGEGTIELILPLVAEAPSQAGSDELRFIGTALISTLDGRVVARQVQTSPIIVTLGSSLSFDTAAQYFDEAGSSVGSGALPPHVGEATRVRVLWTIANLRHSLENLRVRTTLPPSVEWAGAEQAGLGKITWNASNRTVTLEAGSVPAGTPTITAYFEVSITPQQNDLGNFMTLTNEVVANAKDARTGAILSHTKPAITTEFLTDEFGNGRGAVVE